MNRVTVDFDINKELSCHVAYTMFRLCLDIFDCVLYEHSTSVKSGAG